MNTSPGTLEQPLPDDLSSLKEIIGRLQTENAQLRNQRDQLQTDNQRLQTENTDLRVELARLRDEETDLRDKLDKATRLLFGKRSERKPRTGTRDNPKGKRDEHGRAPLPADLERRNILHDLSEAEQRCGCCGQLRVCIGEKATEQLDMDPIHFFVRRTIKRTYSCQHCDPQEVPQEQRIQTAGPAQVGPIPKGLCGPGLLAHVITAKYADHTPLHRLAGQLARSGVGIACSTLGGWVAGAALLLTPLVELMKKRLLLSRAIHSDDTGVKLRVKGEPKTSSAYLWVYIGDQDYPYVVFDFTTDRSGTGPQTFLKEYKGYLQADALAQYEALYIGDVVKHVCCMAHARRKFVGALAGGDQRAKVAVDLIGQLYGIERELPPLLPPCDDPLEQQERKAREEERKRLRHEQAEPILVKLKAWLDEEKPKALPKTPLGQAIGYAWNNWKALKRYVEQGYLAIDNNLSERTLRVIAVGRNNWGVMGSEAGGENAAVLYSIVGTCKHLGIDPYAYLVEALPGIFAQGEGASEEQLAVWLPDRWLLLRQQAAASGEPATG